MSSDFLVSAQSRQDQLTQAFTEALGVAIELTIASVDESFMTEDVPANSYSARSVGVGFHYVLLADEATLNGIGADGDDGGPAARLQSLASSITAALAGDGAAQIDISSPGELDPTALAEAQLLQFGTTLNEVPLSFYVGLVPVDSSSTDGVEGITIPEFDTAAAKRKGHSGNNLGLLADVQVDVTVELGRRRLPINELLTLTRGSIIELDKLVGEPLEVYVNNRLIADGEAVVIDEQFGIRITNIIPSVQRALGG